MSEYCGYAVCSMRNSDRIDIEEIAQREAVETPPEIADMDLETFNQLTYREALTVKMYWPAVYDRLVSEQNEQTSEQVRGHTERRHMVF